MFLNQNFPSFYFKDKILISYFSYKIFIYNNIIIFVVDFTLKTVCIKL